ncbi:MAG: hypothetical protein COB66_06150, partial [Coxiella sp. (in: Bacteria)]
MVNSVFELKDLNGANGFTLNGIAAGDNSGWLVASVGDVNDDGIDDVIIGARKASPDGRGSAGQSYLVFGHNGTWPISLELSSLNGTTGVIINGIAENDESGYSVASAGDINDDGFADMLIGAYFADPSDRTEAGQSYLIFGHNGTWPAVLEISSLNGTTGVIINGILPGDQSGFDAAMIGDVNGDDIDDLMVGAILAGTAGAGRSYLVFGHRSNWPAILELSSLDGTTGVIVNGILPGDQSGHYVASAGDVNGDGIGDVIMGAIWANPGSRVDAGQSYLLFGRTIWPSTIELSSLNGVSGVTINGIAAGDWSGRHASAAGDMNGDGFDDMIIGAPTADPGNRTDAGQSYLVFGHNNSWPAVLELSSLNGTMGVMINGITAGDLSGVSVALAGDVNADGFDDVIIGAQRADSDDRVNTGQGYVVFGHNETWPARLELSSLNGITGVIINGITARDSTGISVAPAGDINNDGIDDVIIGAHKANPDGREAAGQSYVIFGGAEQFSSNQIEIQSGETLTLNTTNLSVEPLTNNRHFTVSNVQQGRFVSTYNTSEIITTFSQQQINDGEVLFIHDGSEAAPSYVVTADSVTRVFSNVHPQAANVSFSVSSTTTSTITSNSATTASTVTSSSSVSSTTNSNTSFTITSTGTVTSSTLTNLAPTTDLTSITINPQIEGNGTV